MHKIKELNISNYDYDEIYLPFDINQKGTQKYIVKCAVIREGNTIHTGNFKCWVRNKFETGWILLDNSQSRKYQRICDNLKKNTI